MIEKDRSTTRFLCLLFFVTNLTQLPQLIYSSYASVIMFSFWGIAFFYRVNRGFNAWARSAISNFLFLIMLSLVSMIITRNDYFHVSLLYPFTLSIFVFCVGTMYSYDVDQIDFTSLFFSYILSGLIVGLGVYRYSDVASYNWLSRSYIYGAKNSVSQILLSVVLLIVFGDSKNKLPIVIKISISAFMLYLLALLKSRASIICLAIFYMYILGNKTIKLRYKVLLIAFTGVFLIFAFNNQRLYNILIYGVIYGGRNVSDINDVSSGRFSMLMRFIQIFPRNLFFGVGNYNIYENMESFPLSLLIQYGIIGSIPIITFLCKPIKILKQIEDMQIKRLLTILLICYYTNGLFEELTPLGPGVKCYLIWFLLGIVSLGKREETCC